jgi:flagellin-like hook-associated protein FlgL
MASNITLSAGVRQNLLSLQNTAALSALTQNRLATGKKVNSALDNPTNFFTSQSLSNRASDLNALLDSIGQAQKTLEAADKGLTSLTKLVESAKSIAKQARQAPQPGAAGFAAITVTGNPVDEVIGVEDGAGAFGAAAGAGDAGNLVIDIGGTDYTIALANGNSLDDFVTTFNGTAGLGGAGAITASNNGGVLRLTANNADVDFTIDAASTAATLTKLQLTSGATTNSTSLLDNIGVGGQGSTLSVTVNGGAAQQITFGTGVGEISTVAELNTALGTLGGVTASASQTAISFSVASSTTQNSLTLASSIAGVTTALGLSAGTTNGAAYSSTPNATRTSLQVDYNALLTQIDALAGDASYNGINLLNGDDLKVVFNETGTSSQTIAGVTYNSAGLGLTAISGTGFQSDTNIDAAITSIDSALSSLRTQASKFGSNLTTVQVRQDFTKNLVNTLQTGADNLVLADSNEEGANLLALQTRQQLSSTALSLSAQADQAVLRLFG